MKDYFRIPAAIFLLFISLALTGYCPAGAEEKSTVFVMPSPSPPIFLEPAKGTKEEGGAGFLPPGDLFLPLITSDLRQPRLFISYRGYTFPEGSSDIAAVGYGDYFGCYRGVENDTGAAWQVSFGGGVFALFDINAPSSDLLSEDYTVGIPFTYRIGSVSGRLMIYHLSAHLGDEYLLRSSSPRKEFSFEAINTIGSYEWRAWRVYAGGEILFRRTPGDVEPLAVQSGLEYRGQSPFSWGKSLLVGAFDLKNYQEHGWSANTSLTGGLEFHGNSHSYRNIRVVFEFYRGVSLNSQSFIEEKKIRFFGLGIYFGY